MRSLNSRALLLLVLVVLTWGTFSASAQEGPPPLPGEVLVGDLGAPRGLAFDAEGNLLVAVAGSGGDITITAPGPGGEMMEVQVGATGKILSIAPDGTVTDLMVGIPSFATANETVGVYRAIVREGSLWVLYTLAQGGATNDLIVEYDLATMRTVNAIAPSGFELDNNPDGNEIDSNVSDIAWLADGTMLITDAGANALLSWTEADGLALVAAWPENSVPTSVEVSAEGDVYVGFLGAGLAPGAGKIEHWVGGELAHTYEGLNAVSDILLAADGTLYAVELVRFGEQGPGPGGVIMVSEDGVTPVADGLPAPFGIAQDANGELYVSFGTIAFAPGMTGGVIRLAGM